jgi:hypothetical protein
MSTDTDDAWHVRIPQRLRASVERIAAEEDRHPAQVVRRLLIRALAQQERTVERNVDDLPRTALIRHTTKSRAWKALSVGAKALFVALQSLHNDRAQNAVWISARDAVEVYGLGSYNEAVGVWFKELEHYGFTVMVQGAHLGLSGKGKSAHYRLTDRWHAGKPPTRDFDNWDGVLFDPPKRIDKRGTARLTGLQKQKNPVCNPQTPCLTPTDIRRVNQVVENGNKCLTPTDIRMNPDCLTPTDIASLPSAKPALMPENAPDKGSGGALLKDRMDACLT